MIGGIGRRRLLIALGLGVAALASAGAVIAVEAAAGPLRHAVGAAQLAAERHALSQTVLHLAGRSREGDREAAYALDDLAQSADALEAAHRALEALEPETLLSGDRAARWRRVYRGGPGGESLDGLVLAYLVDARTVLDAGEPAATEIGRAHV